MEITDRIRRRRHQVLPAGEKFKQLAFRKFEKHQLRPVALRLRVIDFFCAESVAVPAHAVLDVGYFKRHVTKTKSVDQGPSEAGLMLSGKTQDSLQGTIFSSSSQEK